LYLYENHFKLISLLLFWIELISIIQSHSFFSKTLLKLLDYNSSSKL